MQAAEVITDIIERQVTAMNDLAQRRAEMARAARQCRLHPADKAAAKHLVYLRARYAEARIADYVTRIVAEAPALPEGAGDRLAALLRKDGGAANVD